MPARNALYSAQSVTPPKALFFLQDRAQIVFLAYFFIENCYSCRIVLSWRVYSISFYLFSEITQIEDPRVQWRRHQEHMLKDYLVHAQEALDAQKEIYQVKQQRLELAQQEYKQLHDFWKHKLGSQPSCKYLSNIKVIATSDIVCS